LANPDPGTVTNGSQAPLTPKSRKYEELYKESFEARDSFLETINKYLEKRGQPPLDIKTEHNWAEVEQSMKVACDAMEKAAIKDKKKGETKATVTDRMRQGYRALCAHARDAQGFLELIPSDFMCSSVLCGGLKVIFSALEQTDNQLSAIRVAMEEIPKILNDKAASIKIFSEDEELHKRLATLYVAILGTLQFMLKRFVKSSTSE